MSYSKQETKVYEYMLRHGRISQMRAVKELGIMRLGARIWDLRNKRGIAIRDEMIYQVSENGERTHWKEYWLAEP